MARNGSSYRPVVSDTRKPPRQRETGVFMLLLLVFGLALAVIYVPGLRTRVRSFFPPSANPTMNSAVVVWADKQAGSYYCAGSRLYGKKPGSYMRQGNALTHGYQPALGRYCEEEQTKQSKGVRHMADRSSQKDALTPDRHSSVFPLLK